MTQLASSPLVGAQDIFTGSTTQFHNYGEKMETTDGRVFRYAKNSTTLLVSGNLLQAPVVIAGHQTLTPAIFAVGATSISVTMGATNASANQYSNGYIGVNTTPGNGYLYLVAGHAAITNAVAGTINLADQVQVAGTAASICDLVFNPYSGVIQLPVTTKTGVCVGAALTALAASSYGWVQTHGPAMVLSSGTFAVGSPIQDVAVAAGSANSAGTVAVVIGSLMKVGVDAKNVPIYLQID